MCEGNACNAFRRRRHASGKTTPEKLFQRLPYARTVRRDNTRRFRHRRSKFILLDKMEIGKHLRAIVQDNPKQSTPRIPDDSGFLAVLRKGSRAGQTVHDSAVSNLRTDSLHSNGQSLNKSKRSANPRKGAGPQPDDNALKVCKTATVPRKELAYFKGPIGAAGIRTFQHKREYPALPRKRDRQNIG